MPLTYFCGRGLLGFEMSAIDATMRVENVAEIRMSLTLTMTVDDWEMLHGRLSKQYPGWLVGKAIRLAVEKVRCDFADGVSLGPTDE